jgi:hypothetical protein
MSGGPGLLRFMVQGISRLVCGQQHNSSHSLHMAMIESVTFACAKWTLILTVCFSLRSLALLQKKDKPENDACDLIDYVL